MPTTPHRSNWEGNLPKGDRLKLKADPEDGTTPIANLLLEAVAMAKLSGLQKGAILYLWRKTYGWTDEQGRRKKDAEIGLTEWKEALDTGKSTAASTLSSLETKHIFIRSSDDRWGTYVYRLNTNVTEWNSDSIRLDHLRKVLGYSRTEQCSFPAQSIPPVQSTPAVLSNPTGQSSPLDSTNQQNGGVRTSGTVGYEPAVLPTLLKESIKKDKESVTDKVITKTDGVTRVSSEEPSFVTPLQRTTDAVEQAKKLRRYPIEIAPLRKQVIAGLKSRRGYASPQPIPEADAISKMLAEKYTPDDILKVWDEMSREPFWADHKMECTMMSVRKQIGAHLRYKEGATNGDGGSGTRRHEVAGQSAGHYGDVI